jgi:hypothetical protein
MTLRRTILTTGLVLALICLTAPVALADGVGSPPPQASHFDGRSPDTRDAAYVAHHGRRIAYAKAAASSVGGPPLNGVVYNGRSPDTKDAAAAAHALTITRARAATTLAGNFDGRSPDTKDAAAADAAPAAVIVVGPAGFEWADAGIGAAAGFGLAVIAVAALALTRTRGRGALTTS